MSAPPARSGPGANPTWDPAQYLRFGGERARPYWDLLAPVDLGDTPRIVDLGCGPGTQTARLLDRWPGAHVVGVDSSPEMIRRAAAISDPPRLRFEMADLRTWSEGAGADLVVTNATLHWVPGHLDLLGRWLSWLAPGGTLAIGVPANFHAPSHTLLRQLADQPRWQHALRTVASMLAVHSPEDYLGTLQGLGATADVWQTVYYQVLTGADPVLEWVRGSALRPYLDVLDASAAAEFEDEYRHALRTAYPPGATGATVFPFRRTFVVATAPAEVAVSG